MHYIFALSFKLVNHGSHVLVVRKLDLIGRLPSLTSWNGND